MYNPTLRLTILEILQSRGEVSGQDLAQLLEVEERSISRYITRIELPFTVLETDELKSAMRILARDILASIND